MLRVTTIHANTAGPSARYYTRYLADDGPEGEGQWLGRQAAGLGLSGSVSTEELEALLSGHDPVTGAQLGNALVDRVNARGKLIPAVAGFDATFSAPKSLSVWWGLTGDPGFLEAHDAAVRAVLAHVERYASTTRVRVNGHRQYPDSQGLVMASFRQATSREDDPQLHTHVVVSAKVQTADGRWMALDARYLKRKQRALGGLYQSVLRAELTHRYGIAWGPIEKGQAEIAGMPRELLDAFSKRAAQVEAAVTEKVREFSEREGRDPSRWERAALTREAAEDTRATKSHASAAELSGRWIDEAAALGWTPHRLERALLAAGREAPSPAPTVATNDVLELLTTSGSSWNRADVMQAICDLASPVPKMSGRDWANAVEQACERVIDTCVRLDPSGGPVRPSDRRSVWIAPCEPHLTHERVLAEEERILTFAFEAQEESSRFSRTLQRGGLDVLQADAAEAVAGDDQLVLVVGPAGTGKTSALRRAADDLRQQRRAVFGVAPTAKAAKVLGDETRIPADTVAKLLYEWRTGEPSGPFRLPPRTTLVVDEAGMVGTGALDELVRLAVSQRWRLVLVGDPRQLQAVGRGGMFEELCRSGRTHKLATIHRFRNRWEQRASLMLRAGRPDALDAYFHHDRIAAGSFDELVSEAACRWVDESGSGRSVALVAETNDHVDRLNAAVQELRRGIGQIADRGIRVAGSETAAVGDVVVTRRNDRTLVTDRGEPIRNRDRWTVVAVGRSGSLALSHLQGHGTVSVPAEYGREHVGLGYAATAHGHQGDTVDIGIVIVTEATTHRCLYVGSTRGRLENRMLVVTDDPGEVRDVLERVLSNDRADVPAVAQRRNLARQVPRASSAEDAFDAARRAVFDARRRAEPYLQPVRAAEADLRAADQVLRDRRRELSDAPLWRRRSVKESIAQAIDVASDARDVLATAELAAAPYVAAIEAADSDFRRVELETSAERMRERLAQVAIESRSPGLDRGLGI